MTLLLYDAQQFTIYVGFFLLIVGILGNAMNLLVFSKIRTYRTTPCTFYFLVSSIVNLVYIGINLTIRILSDGYEINIAGTSSIWCKIRGFLLVTPSIISINFSCLAVIDQFLVTSKSAYLRRLSQIQWAHRISIISIIIWCLHGIPILLFYDVSLINKTCVNNNAGFAIYTLVYLLGIICAIPVSIMMIFGWLTYRNIRQTIVLAELQADRQLLKMTLTNVVLVVISLLPYGIYNTYSLITDTTIKDSDRQLKEYFAGTIVSMVTYLYYVVC
jgi:hypothetical protein